MSVIHQMSKVSTTRLYGSSVGPPGHVDLADREVQQVPDQEQQQRDAAPAHPARGDRRRGLASATYFTLRAPLARRHRVSAESDVHDERDEQHRPGGSRAGPSSGRIGSPKMRRWCGVLVEGVVAGEHLEVAVHVHAARSRMKRMPLAAIRSFRAMVERDARAPLTRVVVATQVTVPSLGAPPPAWSV